MQSASQGAIIVLECGSYQKVEQRMIECAATLHSPGPYGHLHTCQTLRVCLCLFHLFKQDDHCNKIDIINNMAQL